MTCCSCFKLSLASLLKATKICPQKFLMQSKPAPISILQVQFGLRSPHDEGRSSQAWIFQSSKVSQKCSFFTSKGSFADLHATTKESNMNSKG